MHRPDRGGFLSLPAELHRELLPGQPFEAGALDVDRVQLRQELDNVKCLPGDGSEIEIQLGQSAEDNELTHGGVGHDATGEVQAPQFEQSLVLAAM